MSRITALASLTQFAFPRTFLLDFGVIIAKGTLLFLYVAHVSLINSLSQVEMRTMIQIPLRKWFYSERPIVRLSAAGQHKIT